MTLTLYLAVTNSQRMALTDILLAYSMLRDQPQEFVDVVEDRTTTVGELIRLMAEGLRIVPEEPACL